ncbi:hypothetical protein SLEP1_g27299 [Rubroshorea leprosula]|uniref:Uncharacterized protein n=1 Tax=Rubroshorea leprosula TaxID=152421 RepID=A0AAV5JZB1_9ROSI|nr:hypothetical protein SLEP1_g27299 [Rubroshorea leprosula]
MIDDSPPRDYPTSVPLSRENVHEHLLDNGFISSYHLWDKHGEGSHLSFEDPTSQESAEECKKGNESCPERSSSLDGDLSTSIPTHTESYDGPTVDGLTSSPSEIAPAGSYDRASDPFTSCSTKEIEPTKEIDPSTTPDTEDSAMLYVTGGIKVKF